MRLSPPTVVQSSRNYQREEQPIDLHTTKTKQMATDHLQDFAQQRSSMQPLAFGICVDHQNSTFRGLSRLHFDQTYLEPVYSHFSHLPFPGHLGMYDFPIEPTFLRKRNERERQRVRCVNEGYARLREHLPPEFEDKRLSKVETLRAAISYIKHLQNLLELRIPDAVMELSPSSKRDTANVIQMTECNSDGESKHSLSDSGEQCY
ncbi:achaete-scute homolog 4 [Trichomycterus rosablanca]|uniref:achaete-scute homolog 4 n=1 Tax=Trichomycterus rosablanca TaxID=2290929 RepID=UPI002F35310D